MAMRQDRKKSIVDLVDYPLFITLRLRLQLYSLAIEVFLQFMYSA